MNYTISNVAKTVKLSNGSMNDEPGFEPTVGWFRNSQNVLGWAVVSLSYSDKKFLVEQGYGTNINDIKRTVSGNGNTSLALFNLATGTYAFADNSKYIQTDKLVFERKTKFTMFAVENSTTGAESFKSFVK